LQIGESEFRALFEESGVRLICGIATDAFAHELAERYLDAAPTATEA
jgi:hypothetical protein